MVAGMLDNLAPITARFDEELGDFLDVQEARLRTALEGFMPDAQLVNQLVVSLRFTARVAWDKGAEVCPYDCDNCHSEDCPCDRLGCAGHPSNQL